MKNSQQNSSIFLFALFVLVSLVLYKLTVWDPYFTPPAEKVANTTPGATVAAQGGPVSAPEVTTAVPAIASSSDAIPTLEEIEQGGTFQIENANVRVQLSRLGGRVLRWELLDYAETISPESPRLNLVQHGSATAPFPLGVFWGKEDDSRVLYELVATESTTGTLAFQVPRSGERTFTLRGQSSSGTVIEKQLTFPGQGYTARVNIVSENAKEPVGIEILKYVPEESAAYKDTYGSSGFAWFNGQSVTREHFSNTKNGEQRLGPSVWAAISDQYFSLAVISPNGPLEVKARRMNHLYGMQVLGTNTLALDIYGGPNSYRLLQEHPQKLDLVINFGWLRALSIPLLALLHLFFDLMKNYGLAIVALTIIVKLVTLPLASASFKSMQAMQDIQPDVKRIRETITDSKQQQVELMELYKKRGINPLGGCLPVLIQLPIFLGLYTALSLAIELRHAPFALWVQDLSAPEQFMVGGIGLPVMVILLVISMVLQQLTTPTTMDASQRRIMLIMPLVMGFLFINFPAGLTLYWLVSNIITIGQTSAMRHGGRSPFLVTLGVSAVTLGLCSVLTLL